MATNRVAVMSKRASELGKSNIENPNEEFLIQDSKLNIENLVNQSNEGTDVNMMDANTSPMPATEKGTTDLTHLTKGDHMSMN